MVGHGDLRDWRAAVPFTSPQQEARRASERSTVQSQAVPGLDGRVRGLPPELGRARTPPHPRPFGLSPSPSSPYGWLGE